MDVFVEKQCGRTKYFSEFPNCLFLHFLKNSFLAKIPFREIQTVQTKVLLIEVV
jgi:hypothetical protein